MRWTYPIGRVAGIELKLHLTFLLLIGWIAVGTWSAAGTLRAVLTEVTSVLLLFSGVVLHELGHALTARRRGVGTRDITLLPIGGVARLDRMPERPRDEIAVALAGPLVSFGIAAVAGGAVVLSGQALDLATAFGPDGSLIQRVAGQNLMLGLFNLLPAFPMDGGRVLRAALGIRIGPLRATRIAAGIGRVLAAGLGFLGLLGNPVLVIIALFLWIGGGLEVAETETRHLVGDLPASAAMVTTFDALDPNDPLERAVNLTLAGSQRHYPVVANGQVVGILTDASLLAGLTARGAASPVAASMSAIGATVAPGERLADLLPRLNGLRDGVVAVADAGGLRGLIDRDNLVDLLRIRNALVGGPGQVETGGAARHRPNG